MKLIADSGSTKTRWVLTDGSNWLVTTQGLNPRLCPSDTILQVLAEVKEALPQSAPIDAILFYGAGCGTAESKAHVRQLVSEVFPAVQCDVEGDMLGACRATCGTSPGLVGILGTGSNLCYFDGETIARQRTSTGYILGDEGSGNHIGKRLLKDAIEDRMPEDISQLFREAYPYSDNDFIDRLYRQPYANRFLASLAPFAAAHQPHPYIQKVLNDCFGAFFAGLDYYGAFRQYPLHLVGGITASFAPTIRQVAEQHNVQLGLLAADPLPLLQSFHRG